MHRLIPFLFIVALLSGASFGAAMINRTLGPWDTTAVEHDGSVTQMQFGQDLPRPEWVPVYPNATVVQGSKLVSAALPSGFHSLELGVRASLEDIKQFYTERLSAAGFKVSDQGLKMLTPATASLLGIAGSMSATRAATDDQIDIMIHTSDGLVFPSRHVQIRWNKLSETAAQRAEMDQQK